MVRVGGVQGSRVASEPVSCPPVTGHRGDRLALDNRGGTTGWAVPQGRAFSLMSSMSDRTTEILRGSSKASWPGHVLGWALRVAVGGAGAL